MIGRVEDLQAVLPVAFRRGVGQPDIAIDFVVDTGFTGFLTLPPAAVAALRLPLLDTIPATLANDEIVMVAVHGATVVWDGIERLVEVIATGKRPLLGTGLLAGTEVVMQFHEGGLVTVGDL